MPRVLRDAPYLDAASSRRYLLHEPADHAAFERLATRLGFTRRERSGTLGVDLLDAWDHAEKGQHLEWFEWAAAAARFVAVWGRDWWPRCRVRIERMAASDPDEHVRARAARALEIGA